MKYLLICLILILAAGCSAVLGPSKQEMDAWKGVHFSELLKVWGAPRQILDDGKGGKIYVYYQSSEMSDTDVEPAGPGRYYATERTHKAWRQTLFFTDANGTITDWRVIRN